MSATLTGSENCLAMGTRLSTFEITGVLGEGGFGIVYLAFDHALRRTVAIKEYMPGVLAARGLKERVQVRAERHREVFDIGLKSFINEARLLAQFDHPALVKVYRYWEQNQTAYTAMKYYEGRTVKHIVETSPQTVTEEWCRSVIGPILDALEQLYTMNIVHRDVSPENIIVQDNGDAVLLDFGSARQIISDQRGLTVILKPGYAPIEQYAGDASLEQGPYTDIYALCAVMYFAITGQPPATSIGRMVKDPLVPLRSSARAGFSAAFLAAVDAGLSVRAEDRPQTIQAFRNLLSGDAAAHVQAREATLPAGVPVERRRSVEFALPPGVTEDRRKAREPAPAAGLPVGVTEERRKARDGALPPGVTADRRRRSDSAAASAAPTDAMPVAAAAKLVERRASASRAASEPRERRKPKEREQERARAQAPSTRPRWLVPAGIALVSIGALATTAHALLGNPDDVIKPQGTPAPVVAVAPRPMPVAIPQPPAPAATPAAADSPASASTASASAAAASAAATPNAQSKDAAPDVAEVLAAPTPLVLTPLEPEKPAPAAAPTPAPPATVNYHLAVAPWGKVYVDGKPRGVSPPLKKIALTPGKHKIMIVNPGFPDYTAELTVVANHPGTINHHFAASVLH